MDTRGLIRPSNFLSPPCQNVIEMARAGVPEENIVLAIDSADATEFDTSPDGLIALSKGGVSKNVIAHIQKRGKK